MIQLQINQQKVEVAEGSTLLAAAGKLGISIPTMCYKDGFPHFTSCMVCVVKDKNSGKLLPSCTVLVKDDMVIETDSDEVRAVRKTALELLLGEHVGDCEGPCQRACPANMNIPQMLRQIEAGELHEALITIKKHIALPAVLGRICPAPCEKVCRRGQVDTFVSIRLLKRFVADFYLTATSPYLPECKPSTGKKVAIVGSGPAGLSVAYYLLQEGHACTIFDDHAKPGGMLRYGIPKTKLSHKVLDAEIEIIRKMGAAFKMNIKIGKDVSIESLNAEYDSIVLTTGNLAPKALKTFGVELSKTSIRINSKSFETSVKGIFAGGAIVRESKLAVRSVGHGRSIAVSVNQFLNKQDVTGHRQRFNSLIGKLRDDEREDYLKNSSGNLAQKFSKDDTMLPKQAASEAARCLHCDCLKSENCKLRQYAEEYQANPKQYKGQERKKIEQELHHSGVIYEAGKCIKCGLCVRITESYGERLGLTFIGRGFDVRIGVPLNETLDKGLEKAAALCVEACPTGALAFKDGK